MTIQEQIQKYIQEHQTGNPEAMERTKEVRLQEANIYLNSAETSRDEIEKSESYKTLNANLIEQYEFLLTLDLEIEAWDKEGQPYNTSQEMFKDVRDNHHFYYFKTDNTVDWDNELSINYPFKEKYKDLYVNDIFRIVHDIFGHFAYQHSFSENGEISAWKEHRSCLDYKALPALWTETRGQNAAFYYGDYKDIPVPERPFPVQRIVFPPKEFY